MKKLTALLMAVILTATLAACGGKQVASGTTETVNKSADQATEAAQSAQKSADGIDVDLTAMSSTMVYSEVQNMMTKPTDYLGKTVKMQGAFSVAEMDNNRYFACIIKDATACCSQGIEFIWKGDHSYPDDYPEAGKDITVVGTFSTYMEGSQQYCQLKDAEVKF